MIAKGGYGSGARARSHPHLRGIRFTDDEDQRLTKMLRKRRLTIQAFGHAAIMKALNEIELGKKTDTEIAQDARQEQKKEHDASRPKGFGLRERLQEDRDREDERRERLERERDRDRERERVSTPASAPSLVAPSIDGEILALARTVVDMPKTARAEALRAACRALAKGRPLEEATRLAGDLDAAIKRLDGVPQTALERVRARIGSR